LNLGNTFPFAIRIAWLRIAWRRRRQCWRPYDNALAETVIGLFKTEVIYACGPWRSLDAGGYATLEWVDWFNHRQLLEPTATYLQQISNKRIFGKTRGEATAA